jgi:hypothetical protein
MSVEYAMPVVCRLDHGIAMFHNRGARLIQEHVLAGREA